ncbi:MAG: SLC13 family permease [Vicinamibacterales bacterium]|nr:SLC13 family permease [Vicinamibacterales bacterium]
MPVTLDQVLTLGLMAGILALFIWGRWRYDLVAFTALVAAIFLGLVPGPSAFSGFGHPAVVTVALVLVLSRGLQHAGVVDLVTQYAVPHTRWPTVLVGALCLVGAVLSAFMNNVGALALLMPVAIRVSRRAGISPALVLMPLSFATMLGGTMTLIGTPPNIVIAGARGDALGEPFGMFAFAQVGVPVAVAGVAFLALIGWRLVPSGRRGQRTAEDLFDVAPYVVEVLVPPGSRASDMSIAAFEERADDVEVVALERDDRRWPQPASWVHIRSGDTLLLRGTAAEIEPLVAKLDLSLTGGKATVDHLREDDLGLIEAVLLPGSRMAGRSAQGLRLRDRHGVSLLAVARAGTPMHAHLGTMVLAAGDVVLLQGNRARVGDAMSALGLAPLADRAVRLGSRPSAFMAATLFLAAIAATATGWVAPTTALATATAGYLLLGIIDPRSAYEAIDWPVIVLLGALIPIGTAVETTGAAQLVSRGVVAVVGSDPTVIIITLLVLAMFLSDVMNNAATALVMAPIAINMATAIGVSADPLLLAVAIGASCSFLTPIGHQNNTLILGPGGYRFGDYWRVGLPLEIVVGVTAVPILVGML